jgi:hypothetical protein
MTSVRNGIVSAKLSSTNLWRGSFRSPRVNCRVRRTAPGSSCSRHRFSVSQWGIGRDPGFLEDMRDVLHEGVGRLKLMTIDSMPSSFRGTSRRRRGLRSTLKSVDLRLSVFRFKGTVNHASALRRAGNRKLNCNRLAIWIHDSDRKLKIFVAMFRLFESNALLDFGVLLFGRFMAERESQKRPYPQSLQSQRRFPRCHSDSSLLLSARDEAILVAFQYFDPRNPFSATWCDFHFISRHILPLESPSAF